VLVEGFGGGAPGEVLAGSVVEGVGDGLDLRFFAVGRGGVLI